MANVAFVVGLAVLFIWVIRQLLIAYFSPLAAVPSAHFTAPVSSFWITLTRFRGHESRRRYEAHQRLGPIIRLGPTELGVNCIDDGVKSIYDGNFDKAPRSATLSNYGLPFMLSIMSSKKHSERRRMYSHVYSKTTVENASQLRAISEKIIVKQLHPLLESWSKGHHAVEMLKQSRAFGGDFVSAYISGAVCGTCLFENPNDKVKTINCFSGILEGFFWLTEIPAITVWLHRCGIHLVPESTFQSQERLEDMCLDLFKSAEAYNKPAAEDLTVYAQLRTNLASTGLTGELLEKTVAAELLDHIIAAVHGIGTTLTYAMTQLSTNPSTQTRLRDELTASRDGQLSPI